MSIEIDTHQPPTGLADLIASDDYWGEPIAIADQPGAKDGDEYWRKKLAVWYNTDRINQIGAVAFSLGGGGVRETLEEGQAYPKISDESRKVIRIVLDSRGTIYKGTKMSRLLRELEKHQDEKLEGFDSVAEVLLNPSTWWSYHSATAIRSASIIKQHRIRRELMYMRPDEEMSFGACICSDRIPDQEYLEAETAERVIPILPVGTPFKFGDGDEAKVVRADVLEANGIIWQGEAPKRPPKNKLRKGFLLPQLVPRFSDTKTG